MASNVKMASLLQLRATLRSLQHSAHYPSMRVALVRHLPSNAPTARFFCRSQFLEHAAKRPEKVAASAQMSGSVKGAPRPGKYVSFSEALASRGSSILLYEAPSHRLYMTGCYAFGSFCFTYAGYNFYAQYLHPPADLATWIPIAFGGVCFAMACFGTYLVLGAQRYEQPVSSPHKSPANTLVRLIRRITAVPSASRRALTLLIDVRPMLPFRFKKPKPITISPTDVSISSPLILHTQSSVASGNIRDINEAKRLGDGSPKGFLKHLNFSTWRVLTNLRRVWTREGFIKVQVKGKTGVYRLDTEGRASDALDRLVKVREV
ncbi:hypothetical protein L228DRAFT_265606 [Xylona heveae TC161]|uniref:Uncharacterized protein n=1 Tax=Xylona heveae (strain CBS 132557 / TC161) TaxID=1328760 RepID=A0A165IN12_XYLHT|nr:hypothetical protein L228DRAFT_265606 [Xylona heveae TC161]KZF25132.1 hypothetical protein L228DRAFT_265606 [Xylona heveae TC161]